MRSDCIACWARLVPTVFIWEGQQPAQVGGLVSFSVQGTGGGGDYGRAPPGGAKQKASLLSLGWVLKMKINKMNDAFETFVQLYIQSAVHAQPTCQYSELILWALERWYEQSICTVRCRWWWQFQAATSRILRATCGMLIRVTPRKSMGNIQRNTLLEQWYPTQYVHLTLHPKGGQQAGTVKAGSFMVRVFDCVERVGCPMLRLGWKTEVWASLLQVMGAQICLYTEVLYKMEDQTHFWTLSFTFLCQCKTDIYQVAWNIKLSCWVMKLELSNCFQILVVSVQDPWSLARRWHSLQNTHLGYKISCVDPRTWVWLGRTHWGLSRLSH